MAYMSRLGIWGKGTPFREFGDFIQAVERRFAPVNIYVMHIICTICILFVLVLS